MEPDRRIKKWNKNRRNMEKLMKKNLSELEVGFLFGDIWKNIKDLISIISKKTNRYESKDAPEKDKILLFLRINIPILNKYNVNNVKIKINNEIGSKENILKLIHEMNYEINVINKKLFNKAINKPLHILLIKMKLETETSSNSSSVSPSSNTPQGNEIHESTSAISTIFLSNTSEENVSKNNIYINSNNEN